MTTFNPTTMISLKGFTTNLVDYIIFVHWSVFTYLIKVRSGLGFAHPVKVLHVDQLKVKGQAGIGHLELGKLLDMRQVTQMFIAPVVKVTKAVEWQTQLFFQSAFQGGSSTFTVKLTPEPCFVSSVFPPGACTALCIQVYGGNSQAHKSSEERLLHVGVLLEGHVLDDRGQLVVVSNHNPTLQSAVTILWVLVKRRYKDRIIVFTEKLSKLAICFSLQQKSCL